MEVYNLDVAGLVRRIRRFRYETVKAASSALAHTTEPDVTRLGSYLDAVITYLDWVVAQPQLDLPESSPEIIDLGPLEDLAMPENESLVDLENLWKALLVEIGESQSARMMTGIIEHDEQRMRAILEKMGQFLDNYVAVIHPLDLPESAPKRPQTGPGRRGTRGG